MNSKKYELALEMFRNSLISPEASQEVRDIIDSRHMVIARYQPIFKFENISKLSEEEFRSFLYFENNRHWSGLYRQGLSVCADMDLLRETLAVLLNPTPPLSKRYDKSVSSIKGFGKALATAILLMSAPEKYGVWNNISEAALRQVGLWQDFIRGKTPGQQYEQINQLLIRIASDLGIDLWTLDALMWGVIPEEEDNDDAIKEVQPIQDIQEVAHLFLNDIRHPELNARLIKLSSAPLDTVIREAGVVFESHLRNKVDPNSMKHGVDLIDEALKPGGKLIFSSHPGEQQGVQFLYRGAMQFIRNPPMHKIIDYPESMALQFLRLIDSLMILLDQALIAGETTVDDIRYMLKRRFIRPNHMEIYRILYSAGADGIEAKKLAEAMQMTPQQLSGVLGSLGSRINATEGLENKGGIAIIIDIRQTQSGDWVYIMKPILQKALKEEGLI